uniref:Uncharacterized protein n=1 Tax=viral metagenome TaxID=1070528 RepID=A0A6C0D3V6_9ZZZZ
MAIIYYYYNKQIRWCDDLITTTFIFILYNIYLFMKGTDFIQINKKIIHSIESDDNQTPLFKVFDLVYKSIKS